MALDFVLLEDLSGSFGDDVASVRALTQPLIDAVRSIDGAARFGVSSFVDKPIGPFGGSGDYVYRTDLKLTSDTAQFKTTVQGLSVKFGNDEPEAQLEGLLQTALRTSEVGWQSGAQKFVLLATDASFHEAGDFASRPANDGDTVLDGSPAGTGEDYPTILQLASALAAKGIMPIFAVPASLRSLYEGLVDDLGRGVVVNLSSDSADIADSVRLALSVLTGRASFVGGDGADFKTGDSGIDRMFGALGNDTLDGGAGNDTVDGGVGNDLVRGGAGNDTVFGGTGLDSVDGGTGNDIVCGGIGIDRLTGGTGNDRFSGAVVELHGDTLVDFAAGDWILVTDRVFSATRCTLSADRKTLSIDSDGNGSVDVTIKFGSAVTGAALTSTVGSGTEVRFGDGGSTGSIIGTEGPDVLAGGSGNDTIVALGGNDSVSGNSGLDRLYGGNGNDALYGGEGNDRCYAEAGDDIVYGGNGIDGAHGDDGNDTSYGGNGDDHVTGGNGNDYAYGDAGNDRVDGNDGNDWLYGGTGADLLAGTLGLDRLYGGTGTDIFRFVATADSGVGAGKRDIIADFNRSDGDRIDLAAIDANVGVGGDQAFVRVSGALTGAGQVRWFSEGGKTIVQASTDSDAAAEIEIELTGVVPLQTTDLLL